MVALVWGLVFESKTAKVVNKLLWEGLERGGLIVNPNQQCLIL